MKYEAIKQFSLDKTILMKVTSRERPQQLLKCVEEHLSLANNTSKMVWLFSFDDGDVYSNKKFKLDLLSLLRNGAITVIYGDSESKIHAINRDVNQFKEKWDILLNISDDQLPIVKGYDDIIRSSIPDDLDSSLWFYDGHQTRINTQEILGRVYYERQGYIYDPRFRSFFCDNYSTLVAQKSGKLRIFKECIIKHFHPGWDSKSHIKYDELYNKNDRHWNHDEELFNQLVKGL